jgi:adenylosuccinate lyase
VLSHEAAHQVKQLGLENDLIARVRADSYFAGIVPQLDTLLDPKTFVGRAPEQVDGFLAEWVQPALGDQEFAAVLAKGEKAELSV